MARNASSQTEQEIEDRLQFWCELENNRRDRITTAELRWLLNFTPEMVGDLLKLSGLTVFSDPFGSGTRYVWSSDFLRWQRRIEAWYRTNYPDEVRTA
jgi:hypothetical protein